MEDREFEKFLHESLVPYRRERTDMRGETMATARRSSGRGRRTTVARASWRFRRVAGQGKIGVFGWAGWAAAAVLLIVSTVLYYQRRTIIAPADKTVEKMSFRSPVPPPVVVEGKAFSSDKSSGKASGAPTVAGVNEPTISPAQEKAGRPVSSGPPADFKSRVAAFSREQTGKETAGVSEPKPLLAGEARLYPQASGEIGKDTLSFNDGSLGGPYEETDIRVVSAGVVKNGKPEDMLVVGRYLGDPSKLVDLAAEGKRPLSDSFSSCVSLHQGHRYLVRLSTLFGVDSYLVEVVGHKAGEWVRLKWKRLEAKRALACLTAAEATRATRRRGPPRAGGALAYPVPKQKRRAKKTVRIGRRPTGR